MLTCLAGLHGPGASSPLRPTPPQQDVITREAAGADQGSASMSARATAMAVMLIVIAPITTIATPMGMARGGGTVTVIGISEHQF